MGESKNRSHAREERIAVRGWLPRLVARIPATVHAKLLLGFLAIAALLIVLGAVGLQVLSEVNRRAEGLVPLQRKITDYHQLQRDTSLPPSWSWNERTLDAALGQLNQFSGDIDRLPSATAEDAEAMARARETYDRLTAAIARVLELTRAGQAAEARELLLAQANPLADRLERLTNELVNRAEMDLADRIAAGQSAYVTSRWIVIGFAVGSIALALVLGYAISWSLVGPVTQMDTRLKLVAAGDFSQRLEVPNRDELGALAAQFNRMAAQLHESYADLEERTRQLTESLDQQTATSEVLRVFASSPTDVRPVLDAIVANGARLCGGRQCVLFGLEGDMQVVLATHNYDPEGDAALRSAFPRKATRDSTSGRAISERRIAHIPDVAADPEYGIKDVAGVAKYRAVLSVPLMREGDPIGALSVGREAAGAFSDRQIDLLRTSPTRRSSRSRTCVSSTSSRRAPRTSPDPSGS